ncbi:MAG TPA: rhodanese-like domain-containing protein [Dissulfurispiraceae bacterium]|nr:rhodanese-like domain-containing protein [Dissulfurispiraceae bacterium]
MTGKLRTLIGLPLIILCLTFMAEASDKTAADMVKDAKAVITEMSPEKVKALIDNKEPLVILDVRDRDEFETGYIPGAINISRGTLEFKANLMLPDKKARVIVYCGVDLRSPLATKTLNDLGYTNAVNLTGGLQAWKSAGYPVVKPGK